MSYLYINGIESSLPISTEAPLRDLFEVLRRTLVSDSSLISVIRINGTEISEKDAEDLALCPFSNLSSLEIVTAHPKEVADETIHHLLRFLPILENLSIQSAHLSDTRVFLENFCRLLDGINTLTEAISHIKLIFKIDKIEMLKDLELLENQLLILLRDILKTQEEGNSLWLSFLLAEKLPNHLREWREHGLPALLRTRDS